MRKHFLPLCVLVGFVFLTPAPVRVNAGAERIVSKYTSTARSKSLSYNEERAEGVDGFRALFPGFGGYRLEHTAGDERSWINVRYGKRTADLYVATMEAGGGTNLVDPINGEP